jgi:hypothetical protein
MLISESFDYPADVDTVFVMMTDEDFHARKCEATHAITHSESVTLTSTEATVVTVRELPTDGFPDFARSFVGQSIHVTETIIYGPALEDGTRVGDLQITMGTAPIGLTGTVTVAAIEGGTRVTVEGDLKARVPFIGGKVEEAAAPSVLSGIRKERQVGLAWLQDESA